MKLPNLFLPLILLLNFSECKKPSLTPDHGLPAISQNGKNIFACLRNGQPWISDRDVYSMMGYLRNDSFYIRGTLDRGTNLETLNFFLFPVNNPLTTHAFTDTTHAYAQYMAFGLSCFPPESGYGQSSERKIVNGSVTITRADNNILSGTFAFDVPTDYCDTIHFTDGRFDLRQYSY